MIASERLADIFVEVVDALVDGFEPIVFLSALAECVAGVPGASVGLLLADDDDELQYAAASTDVARSLDLFQLQTLEGPCPDCFRSQQPVVVADLGSAVERWPAFVPVALAVGIHSVHTFPLGRRDRAVGAINVFGENPLSLDPAEVKVLQALADVATISLLQGRAISRATILSEQLQGALESRMVIEQAKGVIARSNRVSVETAFDLLRAQARSRRVRLGDLAHDVVTGVVDVHDPVRRHDGGRRS